MRSIGSCCALLALGFAATAHAGSWDYRLVQYPSSSGDCHQVARDLGARLTDLSGMPLTRAYCADIGANGYDLRFEYAADDELPLVTTINRLAGPDAQGGIYPTIDDCYAALPAERARFEAATGLPVFVAYCQKDAFASRPYAAHIDAFGQPIAPPRVEFRDTAGDPVNMTSAQIEAQINDSLRRRSINYSYARYAPLEGTGYGVVSLLYYAAERLPLDSANPVHFQTQGQCLESLTSLKSVFAAQTPAPLVTFCAYRAGYRTYDIVTVTFGKQGLLPYDSAEHFASRDVCEGARPELVARYRDEDGRRVEASACSYDYDTREWRVVMLERQS